MAFAENPFIKQTQGIYIQVKILLYTYLNKNIWKGSEPLINHFVHSNVKRSTNN